jgi:peptidoglycan-associated lipoprotein
MKDLTLSRLAVVVCLGGLGVVAGCHKKVAAVAPPAAPAVVPASAPTARITVNPAVVTAGQNATLTWNTANATGASISGIGTVATSGTRSIAPTASADYTLTAQGAGGTAKDTARVTVNRPPPARVASATEEQLFNQNVKDTYFDYDKYTLRPQDAEVAQADAAFLAKHPDMKVVIGGHSDERGSEEYNLALSENRAEALKSALQRDGVTASQIRVVSYGKERPFCTDSDEQCWHQNRRDHLSLDR